MMHLPNHPSLSPKPNHFNLLISKLIYININVIKCHQSAKPHVDQDYGLCDCWIYWLTMTSYHFPPSIRTPLVTCLSPAECLSPSRRNQPASRSRSCWWRAWRPWWCSNRGSRWSRREWCTRHLKWAKNYLFQRNKNDHQAILEQVITKLH